MKTLNRIFAGLLALSICAACSLDRSPLTSYGSDTFLTNEQNAQLALTGLYHAQISFGTEEYNCTDWWSYQGILMLDVISDNGWDRRGTGSNMARITSGTLTASNSPSVASYWTNSYKKIAACNDYIQRLAATTGIPDESMKRLLGEARFLRAAQYFYLASYFHDVPLVTATLSMEEANTVSKSSRAAVTDWVIQEFKEAAEDLPLWSRVEYGRANRQAALAFKGRTEMMMGKWTDAAASFKAIIDLNENTLAPVYPDLFQPATADALSENIFVMRYDNDKCGSGALKQFNPTMDGAVGGWCLHNVTASLFEAYQFTDGTDFSYRSPLYDPADLAANRDPRLAQTLYWNGAAFGKDIFNCDPDDSPAAGKDRLHASYQCTKTGYMMRKYIDENYIYNGGDSNKYPMKIPVVRYADVLLSYVEARMEAGALTAADLVYLNMVRSRSGMPDISDTAPDALRPKLRNERRVELALEGTRLWDLLRWGTAAEALTGDFWGASFPGSPATIARNNGQGKVDPEGVDRWYAGTRNFAAGPAVWPIPQSEQDINPNLK